MAQMFRQASRFNGLPARGKPLKETSAKPERRALLGSKKRLFPQFAEQCSALQSSVRRVLQRSLETV
jgi:hypothetical protein